MKISKWRDSTKILIFRIWMAGAVFLFVGMTPYGGGEGSAEAFAYQLIFTLALGLFLADILIIRPVCRLMFDIDGIKAYLEKPLYIRIILNILYFLYLVLLVTAIAGLYWVVNTGFKAVGLSGQNGTGFLPAEPFSFSLFYFIIFYLSNKLYQLVIKPRNKTN